MEEEFDLLAGHDLGESAILNQNEETMQDENILVWHKMETEGFQPSAREGHSAVTNGLSVFIFGGLQTGLRTNTVLSLNVITGSWQNVACSGDIPPPRTYHAACAVDNYMFIHGGEGQLSATNTVKFQTIPDHLHHSQDVNDTGTAESSFNPAGVEDDKYCGVEMSGVCPGDTLGERISAAVNVLQGSDASRDRSSPINSRAVCLDDLYALDTTSREWFKIRTALAPLPRKGHSMCVAQIEGSPHIVIFGGYSIDNQTLSNSIHVCAVSKIMQYCKDSRHSPTTPNQTLKKPAPLTATSKAVVFRTLSCKGLAPSPRYRHSCTIVEDVSRGEQILVIIGGIGKDATVAMCDVHLLSLASFEWLTIKNGSDGLQQGLAGEGPANGIYGHAAFAVRKALSIESNIPSDMDGLHTELLVYGGSSNAASGKTNCHRFIYAFDMSSHQWRKVSTGFAFPAARNNHSATVVPGWAPSNEAPNGRPRTQSSLTPQSAAVVIFGGVNSIMCASDTWALDLQWRPAGVEQYDGHATQRVHEELAQNLLQSASKTELRYLQSNGLLESTLQGREASQGNLHRVNTLSSMPRIHSHNDQKYLHLAQTTGSRPGSAATTPTATGFRSTNNLHASQLEQSALMASASEPQFNLGEASSSFRNTVSGGPPLRGNKTAISRSFDFGASSYEQVMRSTEGATNNPEDSDVDVGHAFLKVRKERAQSDLLLKRERERAVLAETESSLLQEHLVSLESDHATERLRHEAEVTTLKDQLERSLQRERNLHALNSEAYRLLVLHGLQQQT